MNQKLSMLALILILNAANVYAGDLLHNLIRQSNANWWEIGQVIAQNPQLVNDKNKSNQTPLYIAANHGYANIAQILINGGARVNETCEYKSLTRTALGIAVSGMHVGVVEVLLNAGAFYTLDAHYGTQKNLLIDAAYAAYIKNADPLRVLSIMTMLLNAGHPVDDHVFQAAVNWCPSEVVCMLAQRKNFAKQFGVCRTHFASYPGLLKDLLGTVVILSKEEKDIIENNINVCTDWSMEEKEAMVTMVKKHGWRPKEG